MSKAALAIVHEMIDEPWHPGWQPQPHMLAWFRQFLMMQRDGSMWGSPSSGLVYRVSKTNKTLTLVSGDPNDKMHWHKKNIVTLGKLGWQVLPNTLDQSGQASFSESEEDDLKDEIGRMTTPVPDERGDLTFKHGGSTLTVENSRIGYHLPVIQPIYYGSPEDVSNNVGHTLYTDAILALRSLGHDTVKAVLDGYVRWGTAKVYIRENEEGHPTDILTNLDAVRKWVGTSGKVAVLRIK